MTTISVRPPVATKPDITTLPPRKLVAAVVDKLADVLARHSITALRVALGVVFLAFAGFKYVAGASPAESIAVATMDKLSFGIVTGDAALLMVAVTETVIGLTLITGKFLKIGLLVLAGAMVGIMSPLALFPDLMWADNGPTLLGQYVFKDVVLVTGAMVVAAHALGARFHRG